MSSQPGKQPDTNGYGHRAIWAIGLPMVLSAISVPLLGAVDTAVMGHLDSPGFLAGVAAGSMVFNVLFLGLNFLRMGTTGVAAQAYGAGNSRAVTAALMQPMFVAIALAVLIIALQSPIASVSLAAIQPEAASSRLFEEYFSIRVWSAPAALINLVIIGWLLGMQDGRGPLLITVIINGSNIVLDLLFVVGLGMDVDGVAIATVIAQYLGLAIGLWLVQRQYRNREFVAAFSAWLNLAAYRQIFALNGYLFIRSVALMFVFAFVTAQGARLGDVYLAANAILLNFLYFFAYAADGIAHAAEALTGKAVGAKDSRALTIVVKRCLLWCAGMVVAFTVAYGLFGAGIIRLLTDIPVVIDTAHNYLPWLILLPVVSAWCFLYDGVYVGTTRSREMMIVMVGCVLGVYLPCWYLLLDFGNHALWAAMMLFMLVRSVAMHVWYLRMLRQGQLIRN